MAEARSSAKPKTAAAPPTQSAKAESAKAESAKAQAAKSQSAKQADQLRGVLVEAARTQLAAVTAGITFWAEWVASADKYTRAVNAELAKLEEAGESGDIVGRLSDLTREYLRTMTQLPSTAVKEFNTQLETIGKPKAKRTRAAKVKE